MLIYNVHIQAMPFDDVIHLGVSDYKLFQKHDLPM